MNGITLCSDYKFTYRRIQLQTRTEFISFGSKLGFTSIKGNKNAFAFEFSIPQQP